MCPEGPARRRFGRTSGPLSSCCNPQAALKCSCRSDRLTRGLVFGVKSARGMDTDAVQTGRAWRCSARAARNPPPQPARTQSPGAGRPWRRGGGEACFVLWWWWWGGSRGDGRSPCGGPSLILFHTKKSITWEPKIPFSKFQTFGFAFWFST